MPPGPREPAVHTAYIHTPERSIREMAEEGVSLPAEAALLTYRDARNGRPHAILFPSRSAARSCADALVKQRRARRAEVRLLSLEEALS